ncbi:hypothetical protein OC835_003011 [Tilletia horrida]|nr:hypothetical protein OC835_003011 [Tilletia horrida]
MPSSVEDLQSPSVSDVSSPDELTLSEISSLDGFEMVEPEDDGDGDDASPALSASAAALARHEALRDRHEAVLLSLRPELPPTVFHFPDPSAQSDDEVASSAGTGNAPHNAVQSPPKLLYDPSFQRAELDADAVSQALPCDSTVECRSESTATTARGINKQPRWLARTSAWLATISTGAGAERDFYTLPRLSLGDSFTQSLCDALVAPSRSATAAPSHPASRIDGQPASSSRDQGAATQQRGELRQNRWQATSWLAFIAFAAALISVTMRWRLTSADGIAPRSDHLSSPSSEVGHLAPVSLQVWTAVDLPKMQVSTRESRDSGPMHTGEEPYRRVQRVLDARRRRRQAKAFSNGSRPTSARRPPSAAHQTNRQACASSCVAVGTKATPGLAGGSQVPYKRPCASPPYALPASLLAVEGSSSSLPSIDWNAVLLFIRSLVAEAQARLHALTSLILDLFHLLDQYRERAYKQVCKLAEHLQDTARTFWTDFEAWLATAASTTSWAVRQSASVVAEQTAALCQPLQPYVRQIQEKVRHAAGRAHEAASDSRDVFEARLSKAAAEAHQAASEAYQVATQTAEQLKHSVQENEYVRQYAEKARTAADHVRKTAQAKLDELDPQLSEAAADVYHAATGAAHAAAESMNGWARSIRHRAEDYKSSAEKRWTERNEARAREYRRRKERMDKFRHRPVRYPEPFQPRAW